MRSRLPFVTIAHGHLLVQTERYDLKDWLVLNIDYYIKRLCIRFGCSILIEQTSSDSVNSHNVMKVKAFVLCISFKVIKA